MEIKTVNEAESRLNELAGTFLSDFPDLQIKFSHTEYLRTTERDIWFKVHLTIRKQNRMNLFLNIECAVQTDGAVLTETESKRYEVIQDQNDILFPAPFWKNVVNAIIKAL